MVATDFRECEWLEKEFVENMNINDIYRPVPKEYFATFEEKYN